jgi:DNA-binding GntR family transcriptional regulator
MTARRSDSSQVMTRNETVYNALRADILAGRAKPGQKLPFAELVARHGGSIGVIREALQRLVVQGLVESEMQQGFRVVPISVSDLLDLTDARCEIECLALRRSVAEGDVQWEGRAIAAHHVLERATQFDPNDPGRMSDDWEVAHSAFHESLIAGCTNKRILAMAIAMRESAELYRRWSIPFAGEGKRDIAGEHKAILDAVVARDADLAAERLAQHIRRTTEVLTAMLEANPM